MLTPQENIYEITWLSVFTLAQITQNRVPDSASVEVKQRAHEKFITQIASLNLAKIEKDNNQSFKAWLIDMYHDQPDELIRNLFVLQWCRHPFHDSVPSELHILEHICSKPKAIEILRLLFKGLHSYNFHTMAHRPPYSIPSINPELFLFLLDNYKRYMAGDLPIFWALFKQDIPLLERIMLVKPEWVDQMNISGETPLMLAIRSQNEAMLLKILEFKPKINLINFQRETIAHILCQTENTDWLIKLIYEPEFESLEIYKMLLEPHLIDYNDQIPLCHILNKGLTGLVSTFIDTNPELKRSLFVNYYQAIENHHNSLLPILFHDFDLNFFKFPELIISFILNAIKFKNEEALNWLLELPPMDRNLRNAALFYNLIENGRFSALKTHLQSLEINWAIVPYQLPYKITTTLIKKEQSKLIAELGLFDFHPHFHSHLLPLTPKTKTVIHFLELQLSFKLDRSFVTYFLEYLEINRESYPGWLLDFHEDLFKTMNILNVDKNVFVHDQPLLFFVENYCFKHYGLEKRTEVLKTFLSQSVLVDMKNFNGQHLFAHLLTEDAIHGLQRIQLLKNVNPRFSLDNLDSRGSNLLHLAIEASQLDGIRWCLNQNIDAYATRTSDGLSSVQLILDSRNFEMFDILRKHIKKSAFLSFIEALITQKKDELIEFLFKQERPFSWPLTDFHLRQIKVLEHPFIQALFSPKPKAEPVAVADPAPVVVAEAAPKKVKSPSLEINLERLLGLIENKNHKQFENLIQAEYQEKLREIFSEHFHVILHLVFSSDCKSLNKTFIRIPAAIEEIAKADTWHQLCLYALEQSNPQIIENMTGRQAIFDHLKTRIMDYYHFAIQNNPEFWSEHLFKLLPVNQEEMNHLFEFALDSENPDALKMFLAHESHHQYFVKAVVPVWNRILQKGSFFLESCLSHSAIEQALLSKCRSCYLMALQDNASFIQHTLLSFPSIRQNIREAGQEYFQQLLHAGFDKQVIPVWASHQELAIFTRPYFHVRQMTLPAFVQSAFRHSLSGQNTLYLVGSVIHHILGFTPIESLNDIDFISTIPPQEGGIYRQSKVQPQLFSMSLFLTGSKQFKLEYYVSRQDHPHFISQDYLNRDFTVNALYCDHEGKIYDPCNMGLKDLQERKIRSIQNPAVSFGNDPIRLLRAIRLIIKGFQLTPEVESAMLRWEPKPESIHYGHLYSMANQMLHSPHAQQIFSLLIRFDLVSKLLNFPRELPFPMVQDFVNSEAYRHKYSSLPSPKR